MKKWISLTFVILTIILIKSISFESHPNFSYMFGNEINIETNATSGILLAGGGTIPVQAMKWFLEKCRGGDCIILTFDCDDKYAHYVYDYITSIHSALNSVEIIPVDSRYKANSERLMKKIMNAEALFISGGNQSNYVRCWKNTKLSQAINTVVNQKKIPIGGTSAGLAVLGEFYYSASNEGVISQEAVTNPYNRYMYELGTNFLKIPYLKNVITDTHYAQRNRQERHMAFMARIAKDYNLENVRGIGVDEETALCIEDSGMAIVYGPNKVFFLKGKKPALCELNKKLKYSVEICELKENELIDLKDWEHAYEERSIH